MPKEEIASLDMHFLVKELDNSLAGGVIKKIYQYGQKENYQFLFEIYKNKENLWLYFDSSTIFLAEYKKTAPMEPPSFCMFLRKHLMGARIRRVSQHKFDRIIEIETESNFLILELFSRGNVILTDSSRKIIMPLEIQRWRDREIKPRIYYKHPVSGINPFEIDLDSFRKIISKEEKTISSVLAVGFGFGKEYAAEICHSAKIDAAKLSKDLTLEQIISLYGILENLEKVQIKPTIYTDFVSVFPMETFANRKPLQENMETISKAFDEYFSPKTLKPADSEPERKQEEQKKIEHILKTQKEAQEKLAKKLDESKSMADIIYLNYSLVESMLSAINKLLKLGKKWPEIKQIIEAEDTPETSAIKEIREHEGTIIVSLSGKTFELDINKSVQENAEMYYIDAKKSKAKLEGVKSAIERGISKIEASTAKTDQEEKPEVKQRKKWHEKFKWFLSSSGMLVIAGRDATQNENIVKKHAEPNDFLFHADIPGAAFVLVKSEGKKVDEVTMKEASEFSAACSKAWTRGIGNADAYAFRPEQATKPSSLGKGSFVIQGQRIWFRDMPLKLSVGIKIDREKNLVKVISGPVMAIRKHSNYFLTIQPGHKDSLELAREIKNKILLKSVPEDRYFIDKIPIGDIQIHIPSGKGEIVE